MNWMAKLNDMRQLRPGGDSYDAEMPSEAIISTVGGYMQVTLASLMPDRLSPSVVGGIGITYRVPGRKAYLEFGNAGNMCCWIFVEGQCMRAGSLSQNVCFQGSSNWHTSLAIF